MYLKNPSKNPQFLPNRPSPLSSANDSSTYSKDSSHHASTASISPSSSSDSISDLQQQQQPQHYPSSDLSSSQSHSQSHPILEPSSIISHESRQRYIRQQMERERQQRKRRRAQDGDDDDDNDVDLDDDDDDDDDVDFDDPLSMAPPSNRPLSVSPSPLPSPSPSDTTLSSGSPSHLSGSANSPASSSTTAAASTSSIPPSSHYTKSVPAEFFNKLRSFPLFKNAPKSFHTRIVSKLKLIQYHAQEYIIKKGDPSKSMYWILKGNVAVTSTDGESIYAELIPGAFFGEIGILFNRPRTATVVAKTRVLLGVLTSESLNMVLPEYPVIERRIRDEAQERLAILEKKSRASKVSLSFPPLIQPIGAVTTTTTVASGGASSPSHKPINQPHFFNHLSNSHLINVSPGISPGTSPRASPRASPVPSRPNSPNSPGISPGASPRITAASGSSAVHAPSALSTSSTTVSPSGHLVASILSPSIPSPSIPPIKADIHSNSDEPKPTDNVDFTISIQEFIKSLPIFQNLPSEIIHELALGVEPLTFQPFEYIFRKDDIGSDIYFIIIGEVEVIDCHNSNPNYEKCLARLGYGSYFGEMSFLMQLNDDGASATAKRKEARRSANIRTVSNCELIVVRHDKLEEICKTYPFLIEEMKKTAGERNALNNSKKDNNRLSINFLMNDIDIPNSPISSIDSRVRVPMSRGSSKRKIETLGSSADESSGATGTAAPTGGAAPVAGSGSGSGSLGTVVNSAELSILQQQQATFPKLNLSLPPLNPQVPSINKFRPHEAAHHHGAFKYLSHTKRLRLASIGGSEKPSKLRSSTIPDSLLLKAFEYLTLPELMKLRTVCRKWRQLLYFAPNLFQTLDLTRWNTSIDDKSLINITDFVGSRPKVIDISNCFHVTDEGFSYMINEVGISGQIKILRMRSIWEVSAMAIMDLSVPSVGKHLEELDLSNCRKVRDNVLERLFGWNEHVIPPPSAVPTNAIGNYAHEDDRYDVSVGCKNLRKLNVGYCKHLTDDIMYHISVHVNQTLEILNLTRCTTITDRGFHYWSYTQFPKLRDLTLKDCTFLTDQSITAIASSAKNLEHLNLNFCCALSDAAIEVLSLGCPYLKTLDLSFCGSAVSDSSLVKISLHLKNLEKLTVKGCVRVTRAGIDSILSGCSSLYYLDVSQCKNAHIYPGRIPAQKLNVNAHTKSAFVTAGPYQNVIEIVI